MHAQRECGCDIQHAPKKSSFTRIRLSFAQQTLPAGSCVPFLQLHASHTTQLSSSQRNCWLASAYKRWRRIASFSSTCCTTTGHLTCEQLHLEP